MRDIKKLKEQPKSKFVQKHQPIAELEKLNTEHEQAENILRESEEQYRDLLEDANDLIQSVAPDGHFLYVNRTWQKVLGYSNEDIANLTLWDIIHPDSRYHCREAFQKVLLGETINNIEAVFVAKDGKLIPVEGNINCRFVDGKPFATRSIFRDITERKRAQEEVRRARDDYLSITNLTGDIIVKINTEGRWTFVNDGACQFWGKPRKELIGSAFADYLHPDDQEKAIATAEDLKSKKLRKGLVNRQKTPKGWRTVEWNGAALFDEEGRYIGFQATGRDITERKHQEAKIAP